VPDDRLMTTQYIVKQIEDKNDMSSPIKIHTKLYVIYIISNKDLCKTIGSTNKFPPFAKNGAINKL